MNVLPIKGGTTPRKKDSNTVPGGLLRQLRQDIADRRIEHGIQLLRENSNLIRSCGPKHKNSALLIGQLAQWVDIGFARPSLIKELLARFPQNSWSSLPVQQFACLQMAAGFVNLCEQEDTRAIHHFQVVLAIESEIHDLALVTIANFWIGRCYRRQGRYHDALSYVVAAREAASQAKHFKTVAVIQTLEGWILHQEGRISDAAKTLHEAEEALLETDDYVARGNLSAAYGRINRRNGNYEEALHRFESAINEYKKRDDQHRNLARSLVNIAFVKRLIALELADSIDVETSRNRKVKNNISDGALNVQASRQRVRELREAAFKNLIEAGAIYSRHHDYSGSGNVEVTYGYLHLDNGDLDLSSSRGKAAYHMAEDRNDIVLKARARVLQSAIEQTKVEEQIVDSASPRQASRLALEYAHEAVSFSTATQNRPLIAQSLITLGSAALAAGDLELARDSHEQAARLLKIGSRDYLVRQLQILKTRLSRVGAIEPRLLDWSRGVLGNKSFQAVTEEFAAIVIPKVWQREGSKISRVAEILSISPKKVRRILRNQGLLKAGSND